MIRKFAAEVRNVWTWDLWDFVFVFVSLGHPTKDLFRIPNFHFGKLAGRPG